LLEAMVGGPIASHFPEVEHRVFRGFLVDDDAVESMFGDPATLVTTATPHSYIGSAGVTPTPIPEASPNEEHLDPIEDFPPRHLADASGQDDGRPSGGDIPPAIRAVQHRLLSFSKPLAGTVQRSYSAEGLLKCLELASLLKNTADLTSVLCASASIFFGDQASSITDGLRSRKFAMPSLALMRQARLRLDYLSIMWQRREFLRYKSIRYLLCDSSPQLGWNIFGVLEDRVIIPEAATLSLHLYMQLELNEHWESEVLPLSSSGLGHAGAVKKGT